MMDRRFTYFLSCLSILILMIFVIKIQFNPQLYQVQEKITKKTIKHAFFDIGTNNGDSVKYFLYGNEKGHKNLLNGYAAKNQSIKWDIYMYEANAVFDESLDQLKAECQSLNHKVFLYKQTAVSTHDGKVKFYLDTVNKKHNYWGSSLLEEHPDVIKSNKTFKEVDSIDVSKLIKNYDLNDQIIVKMDIEGAEYDVLMHWYKADVFKYIDVIAIEWHNRLMESKDFKDQQKFILEKLAENNVIRAGWFK